MRHLFVVIMFLLWPGIVGAEEPLWSCPRTLVFERVEVQLLNWELTRDRKTPSGSRQTSIAGFGTALLSVAQIAEVANSRGRQSLP
jgi:hypothetical protein